MGRPHGWGGTGLREVSTRDMPRSDRRRRGFGAMTTWETPNSQGSKDLPRGELCVCRDEMSGDNAHVGPPWASVMLGRDPALPTLPGREQEGGGRVGRRLGGGGAGGGLCVAAGIGGGGLTPHRPASPGAGTAGLCQGEEGGETCRGAGRVLRPGARVPHPLVASRSPPTSGRTQRPG